MERSPQHPRTRGVQTDFTPASSLETKKGLRSSRRPFSSIIDSRYATSTRYWLQMPFAATPHMVAETLKESICSSLEQGQFKIMASYFMLLGSTYLCFLVYSRISFR
jgi:hypothetical protein